MTKAAPSLMFCVGEDAYRLELRCLRAVVPWAELEPAIQRGLMGWLVLEGVRVPVVDLRELLLGEATARSLGARILLLECGGRVVGALATEVFSVVREENFEKLERFDPCEVLGSILRGLA